MGKAPERVIRAWIGRARAQVLATRRAGGKQASREIGKWAALEGDLQALMAALAARDAEIAALRAEMDEERGWRETLRYCEQQWQDERGTMLATIARLTAGIRDAVEGRYARVVLELDDDAPAEASEGLSLRTHLLGLIASEADHG